MNRRHGAIHTPRPDGIARLAARMGMAEAPIPNWFARFRADGDPLGNDQFGDCADAADCQLIRLWGGRADRAMALSRYQMNTGFDPATGQPDNGTDTSQDMASWCAAPILDLDGRPRPIYWAWVDHADETEIRAALARFPLAISVGLPAAIADDPDRWGEDPQPGWTPDEGHRIVLGFMNDFVRADAAHAARGRRADPASGDGAGGTAVVGARLRRARAGSGDAAGIACRACCCS